MKDDLYIQKEINSNDILKQVVTILENQTKKGIDKYGATVNADVLTDVEWITHAQEEIVDLLVYLSVLRSKLDESMKFSEYQEQSKRTAKLTYDQLPNFALGLAGEAGEVADLIKKSVYHGHEFDNIELRKELGDVLWYLTQLATLTGTTLDEIAIGNLEKLKKRYPNGFTPEDSLNRKDV